MGQWPTLLVIATASLVLSNIGPVSANPRLVCYFNSGASLRKGDGQFTVENIDPFLCTHLIFVSGIFNSIVSKGEPGSLDPTVMKFVHLKNKNPKLKIMLSVGSWIDFQSAQYTENVMGSNRANFAHSAAQFLARYGFDGLDFSWPWDFVSPTANDPKQFIRVLTALKDAFKSSGYLLSVAVTANQSISELSYDFPKIEALVDFVNLKSYNMTDNSKSMADHHAPLYTRKWETSGVGDNNVDSVVSYWINKGVSISKLNVGIPFFGKSWTLSSAAYNPPAKASGPGPAGPLTNTQGELAFYEICRHVRVDKDFKAVRSESRLNGPIAYSLWTPGRIWVGYDDVDMVIHKGKYILSKNLGGAVVWDISMDDFKNTCGSGINPLLASLSRTLNVIGQNAELYVSASRDLSPNFILANMTITMLLLIFYSRRMYF